MDSEANKQIIISSKAHEEQGSPSAEQSERAAADQAAPAYQQAVADQDREYGCRYCHKKFSNKQALGGHQNAHKVERALEKNMQDSGYYDEGPPRMNVPAAAFLGPYHRQPDPLHRSFLSWSANAGGGGGLVAYGPRPSGWPASAPRLPPFPVRPNYMPPAHAHAHAQNFGPGTSSAFRPVRNPTPPPGFAGFLVPPGYPNMRNVHGNQHDESGLDLSLKLG